MGLDDAFRWAVPVAGGAAIGLLYFAGLWATVRRVPTAARPGLLLVSSFALRMAVVAVGLAVLAAGDARRVVAALVGFLVVRTVAVRYGRVGPVAAEGG